MKCAVLLSGCGVQDGSEIHESVSALIALSERGDSYICCAPDKSQSAVVDHRTGRRANETRNVLSEAARIARGKIVNVRDVDLQDIDAVIVPGGFGAVTNLCNFALQNAQAQVDPDVASFLLKCHEAGKVIGFMCIAPVVAAMLFGKQGVHLTIGNDSGTAAAIEKFGAHHEVCPFDKACVDKDLKIVSTPAYMLAQSPIECFESARALVDAISKLV